MALSDKSICSSAQIDSRKDRQTHTHTHTHTIAGQDALQPDFISVCECACVGVYVCLHSQASSSLPDLFLNYLFLVPVLVYDLGNTF